MPFKSEAQKHLMLAAAHTPGGYGGVPQSVGEKFLAHAKDDYQEMPIDPKGGAKGRAAGILYVTKNRDILLMRRGDGGDYPHTFAVPGGHQEFEETIEEAARREALEETGYEYSGPLEVLHDDGQFKTYLAHIDDKFDVKICDESTGYVWCQIDDAPYPLHPGLDAALKIANIKTELDAARLMSEGVLKSPYKYANVNLLAIRITGTGLAYRSSIGENVWRDPSIYLNDDFLQRCNGLSVIMDHPEDSILNSKEFKSRAIGSIMLPYINGDEVWGIAKVYDQDAMDEIEEGEVSTSPSVVFDQDAGNITLHPENGDPLLIEGVPFLLDHIAIVTKARGSRGVWDKEGPIEGVLLNNTEVSEMSENIEPKADSAGDKLDAILSAIGGLASRVDAMEKNLPASELTMAADKKHRKDEKGGVAEGPAGEIKPDDDDDDDDDMKHHKKDDAKKHRKDDDEEEMKHDDDMKRHKKHRKDDDEMMDDDMRHDDDDDDDMKMKHRKDDDEEMEHMADCQAAADSVYSAFGKSASRPLRGESAMAYRTRLLRGLQAYSDEYKDVNLRSIKDSKLLSLVEKQIFADAMKAAKSPLAYADGQLHEIFETDRRTGRTISKFAGPMSAWLDQFKVPSLRATNFNTQNVKR